jgi:hypothetical protein
MSTASCSKLVLAGLVVNSVSHVMWGGLSGGFGDSAAHSSGGSGSPARKSLRLLLIWLMYQTHLAGARRDDGGG